MSRRNEEKSSLLASAPIEAPLVEQDVDILQAVTAEFLGTFSLVFLTLGTVYGSALVSADVVKNDRLLLTSLTYGLAYAASVYAFSFPSQSDRVLPNTRHLNPAVSLGLFLSFKISAGHLLLYLLAQVAGSGVAVFVLYYVIPMDKNNIITAYPLADGVTESMVWLMEFIVSYLGVLTILMTSFGHMSKRRPASARPAASDLTNEETAQTHHEINCIITGGVVFVCAAVAGPVSGGFINPLFPMGVSILSSIDHVGAYMAPLFSAPAAVLTGVVFGYKVPLVEWLRNRVAQADSSL